MLMRAAGMNTDTRVTSCFVCGFMGPAFSWGPAAVLLPEELLVPPGFLKTSSVVQVKSEGRGSAFWF